MEALASITRFDVFVKPLRRLLESGDAMRFAPPNAEH
jgi:hypothetical protein